MTIRTCIASVAIASSMTLTAAAQFGGLADPVEYPASIHSGGTGRAIDVADENDEAAEEISAIR